MNAIDGGDRIALIGLFPPGTDPHSYQATPQDLIALNDAHVTFINGLHLEEALEGILASGDGDGVVVSVNMDVDTAGLAEPHAHDEDEGHADEAEGDEHAHDEGGDEHAHDEGGDEHAHDEEGDEHGADANKGPEKRPHRRSEFRPTQRHVSPAKPGCRRSGHG